MDKPLIEYLSGTAVEDVRRLLEVVRVNGHAVMGSREAAGSWSARHEGPWVLVMLRAVRVYYRPTDTGYIVSDCGEMVSEVMRRTGQTWKDSAQLVEDTIMNWDLFIVGQPEVTITGTDLPAAIVAVLSAVARVRLALEEEGNRG